MPIPSEQRCIQCGQMFMGSDVHGYPCPDCQGLTTMPVIDYSDIERRIMGSMGMDTTLFDLYGTLEKSVKDMKKTLQSEAAWANLEGAQKLLFQNWIEDNARAYKDGDGVDWVGAFYDWLED